MKLDRDRYGRYKIPGEARPFPSVTTIVGLLDKPALRFWYAKEAAKHMRDLVLAKLEHQEATLESLRTMDIDALMKEAKARPKAIAEEKADIGTKVHEAIAEFNKTGVKVELAPELRPAFDAYMNWMTEYNVKPRGSEVTIWHKEHWYAGTLDMPANITIPKQEGNLFYIHDFKTATNLYPEHVLQLAAYVFAYEERNGILVDGGAVLRLDREKGFPTWHGFTRDELVGPFEQFLCLCQYWHLSHKF